MPHVSFIHPLRRVSIDFKYIYIYKHTWLLKLDSMQVSFIYARAKPTASSSVFFDKPIHFQPCVRKSQCWSSDFPRHQLFVIPSQIVDKNTVHHLEWLIHRSPWRYSISSGGTHRFGFLSLFKLCDVQCFTALFLNDGTSSHRCWTNVVTCQLIWLCPFVKLDLLKSILGNT